MDLRKWHKVAKKIATNVLKFSAQMAPECTIVQENCLRTVLSLTIHVCVSQVRQRGPYVYRELVHQKIDVHFTGTTTKFHVWRRQQFDEELTTVECGLQCTEHDQVFLFLSLTLSYSISTAILFCLILSNTSVTLPNLCSLFTNISALGNSREMSSSENIF